MRKNSLLALAALAALAAAHGGVQATTLPYKGLDKLVAEADGIVLATVRQVQSVQDSEKDIHTFVTFDHVKMLGGRHAAPTLTLRLRGGHVGNESLRIDGAPQFKADERVLMFVQGNGRDLVPLVGWNQGLFRLVNDRRGALTVADADGHPVVGLEGDRVMTGEVAEADVPLESADGASVVMHVAARGQAGGGTSEDGAEAQVVEANRAVAATPMAADDFLAALGKRISQRALGASPFFDVDSVEVGARAPLSHKDGVNANARANAVVQPAAESAQPQAPQRREIRPVEGE
jgi:hypothetical protein